MRLSSLRTAAQTVPPSVPRRFQSSTPAFAISTVISGWAAELALNNAFKQSNGQVLVYMDLDLATDLRFLKPLVEAISVEGYDFATGSRMMKESNASRTFSRGFSSKTYNYLVRHMLGLGSTITSAVLRVLSVKNCLRCWIRLRRLIGSGIQKLWFAATIPVTKSRKSPLSGIVAKAPKLTLPKIHGICFGRLWVSGGLLKSRENNVNATFGLSAQTSVQATPNRRLR